MSSNHKYIRSKLLQSASLDLANCSLYDVDTKEPLFRHHYIYPLCLMAYDITNPALVDGNILTAEDVPPASVGGKPIVLTCRKCNSTTGSSIDIFLKTEMQLKEPTLIQMNNRRVRYNMNGVTINATLQITNQEKPKIRFNINTLINNPENVRKFKTTAEELFKHGTQWGGEFRGVIADSCRDVNASNIALLKAAYLLAFERFGYIYILCDGLDNIRKQILNPQEDILPKVFVHELSNSCRYTDNIYLADFKGQRILIVIKSMALKNSPREYRYAVVLPCTPDDALEVYQNIKEQFVSFEDFEIIGPTQVIRHNEE